MKLLHIDVHREDGAQGIQRRADGRDKTSREHREDQSYHAHREEILHHREISLVRIVEGGEEGEADHARQDIQRHVENLQPSREVRAELPFSQILSC